MTDEQEIYTNDKPDGLDRIITILTLVVCYIIAVISIFILLGVANTLSEGVDYSPWVWIVLFSIVIYGSVGVVSLHVYLETSYGKPLVTFYKVTAGLIITYMVIAAFKSNKK